MHQYFELLESFLQDPNEEAIKKLMDSEALVWINWREDDVDIIRYFNDQLEDKIEIELVDHGKDYGNDIVLKNEDKALQIPYQGVMDRDITIQYLNDFLKPKYEIRWFLESLGNDTLGFVLFSEEDWLELEKEFGEEEVEYFFLPIDLGTRMFDLDMDEVQKLLNFRR